MSLLQADQNSTYYLPFMPSDKVYIRTGVHADGSCFFHAFLRATKPHYRHASYTDRLVYATRIREKLSEAVSSQTLSELNNKELRTMLFFQQLRENVARGFPKDAHGDILNQLINLETVLEMSSSFDGNFYLYFLKKIIQEGEAALGAKFKKFEPYVTKWCYDIFLKVNEKVIEQFKLKLLHDQVSSTEVEFIARQLQCNFLFIQDDILDKKIYPFSADINPLWPYVILLWKEGIHYEIIGEMKQDKTVMRKFSRRDQLVDILLK